MHSLQEIAVNRLKVVRNKIVDKGKVKCSKLEMLSCLEVCNAQKKASDTL